ncbi:MAG: TatD DNase family protein [Parcubacteria bacterium C7867-005]|nr:MAG: TatD DNase family protein [Parcubacteria bacterium C7867-005]
MPKYIDIHSHLNSHEYDADREAVMERLALSDTQTIVIGTDYETSKWAVELAGQHENIYACIGVHPVDDPNIVFEKEKFEELVKHPKVVAVGECGIDLFRINKDEDFERQKRLFLEQIDFALGHDKPIMIHSRSAYVEVLEILEPLVQKHGPKLRGNSHFFTGTLEEAKRYWAIGFTTSFTGVITFARDYDEVIRNAPLGMIMSETDAPYVAPVPYRGKRNEPSYVSEVAKKIAEIRGESLEIIESALLKNAKRMFKIDLA